jgi:hypothetical protein
VVNIEFQITRTILSLCQTHRVHVVIVLRKHQGLPGAVRRARAKPDRQVPRDSALQLEGTRHGSRYRLQTRQPKAGAAQQSPLRGTDRMPNQGMHGCTAQHVTLFEPRSGREFTESLRRVEIARDDAKLGRLMLLVHFPRP